ncbi:MAG: heat shock protein HspQ [Rhodospirillales bacterium]
MAHSIAKFHIGMSVCHRVYGFRGIVFDVDPEFDNTEEWYDSIPEDVRPHKNQPYYHLFAETPDKAPYIAYVSEQNLIPDQDPEPIHHPGIEEYFDVTDDGGFTVRSKMN